MGAGKKDYYFSKEERKIQTVIKNNYSKEILKTFGEYLNIPQQIYIPQQNIFAEKCLIISGILYFFNFPQTKNVSIIIAHYKNSRTA